MPGRGSYGAAGRWIHDRAHHIMGKNPDMDKSVAYAVATQQGHKVGKSPKKFRTPEGVRTALRKHKFPKKLYKKTASAVTTEKTAAKKKALKALHSLQKSGGFFGKRVARLRNAVKRAPKKSQVVSQGRGSVPPTDLPLDPAEVAANSVPQAAQAVGGERIGTPSALSRISEFALNPKTLKSGLRFAGLGTVGVGAGALAHQGAHSLGITETGPSDVLAGLVVPSAKHAQDGKAVRALMEEKGMYIPRYYLEKAAAAMAGAVESNEEDQHTGEPGMFGPESSVIPQQTLETVVPIGRHVEKSDDESASFLEKMFKSYTDSKEEVVGRYLRGETEIPLKKQAGRLVV